jgi:DNA-binding phage protein
MPDDSFRLMEMRRFSTRFIGVVLKATDPLGLGAPRVGYNADFVLWKAPHFLRAAASKGLLSEAIESLLSGEVTLGKELLRDYINATVGFPKLAEHTKIHAKTLHQMFGPNGNPTANNLFEIVAYLQHTEGVRFKVRSMRAA